MMLLKHIKIRSYEMGLYFRDGEFRACSAPAGTGSFDPLGKVAGRGRLAARAVAGPREARRDRQVGRARGPRRGARPEGPRAGAGLDRRPLQPHPAAGPVRLLDRPAGRARRGGRRPQGPLRAHGPEGRSCRSPLAERVLDICTVERDHVGVLFIDGDYVETLPPGQYAFWKRHGRRQARRGRPARDDARRRRPGDHDGRQGHAAAERRA